jgi:hypothetical protein
MFMSKTLEVEVWGEGRGAGGGRGRISNIVSCGRTETDMPSVSP